MAIWFTTNTLPDLGALIDPNILQRLIKTVLEYGRNIKLALIRCTDNSSLRDPGLETIFRNRTLQNENPTCCGKDSPGRLVKRDKKWKEWRRGMKIFEVRLRGNIHEVLKSCWRFSLTRYVTSFDEMLPPGGGYPLYCLK